VVKAGEAFVSLGHLGRALRGSAAYQPDAASAVHTFCHALPGTWHQMGVILAAADALNWYAKLVGREARELTGELGELRAPGRTLFLPYLGGERTPHNDAAVRGSFLHLDHATDRAALTRAVLEGVAYAFRDSFDALTGTGTRIERLIAVGGGSRSEYWVRAIATSLGMPIEIPEAGDFGGAFGAARLGLMAATGAGAEIATAPRIERVGEPRPRARPRLCRGPRPLPRRLRRPQGARLIHRAREGRLTARIHHARLLPRHRADPLRGDRRRRTTSPSATTTRTRWSWASAWRSHLRFSVAWWHSFAWPGGDPFGGQTFERPWFGDTMEAARLKADSAFEMFRILGAPFFCWHDLDIRPEGETFAESRARLEEIVDYIGQKMEGSGVRCLWGTANMFTHRRWMAGARPTPTRTSSSTPRRP
jgi:hypothetical protein